MTDNLDKLRFMDGFPKGKDEDLLALSNSPEYTAYPNPHIEEFLRQFGKSVIAGFTECYRTGRYQDILTVGRKLDKSLLENSTDLYDFIDIAEAKVEG